MNLFPEGFASTLLRVLPAGVVLLSDDKIVLAVNDQLRSLVPMHPSPVGRGLEEVMPAPAVCEALSQSVEPGETREINISVGRFELQARVVNLGPGKGLLGVFTDVTEARSVEKARSNFAVSVSHELRTPLTSILGYTDTLLGDEESLSSETVEMLEAIRRNGNRLGSLFSDLLHLFRLESRKGDLPLQHLSVQELAGEVLEEWRGIATERRIDLLMDSPSEIRGWVNPEAFRHILSNLVSNALKYTESEGWVRVRVRAEADATLVEVEDNGRGIEPVYHQRIFERFFRADAGRARSSGGSGLGLSIVKHLCRASQAGLTVHSTPGHGSTFSVRFPLPAAD
ncbi:MAG: ATP-binding protein [Myxococcota bacterium]|nr:ATP-binding protein [Myxococcota bacterium]